MTSTNNQQRYRFSEAPLWELQRAYYEQQGTKAWQSNVVPQYISSNPLIGAAYAEMIFGFLQDRAAQGFREEPVTIVELGAGIGRLAFHVLKQLCELREYAALPLPPFRYVMTDLAMLNVTYWQEHPGLRPFVEQGLLDFARFDAVLDDELHLLHANTTIGAGDLKQPLLLIANYFFDSIPQELIYVNDGRLYDCQISLHYPEEKSEDDPAKLLKQVSAEYHYQRAEEYEQADYPYRQLTSFYQEELDDSHILFPVAGLNLLERLNRLSNAGYVLLTADKGDHRLENWTFTAAPEIIRHGSFSLTANYHAIQYELERQGALCLFTGHHYCDLNVGCLLMVPEPLRYAQTRLGYRRFVAGFGPDDFFSLKQWVDQHLDTMHLQEILAFWRLGGYDIEFFTQTAVRISRLLSDSNDEERLDLERGILLMWDNHYTMDNYDLALDSGLLLFELDCFAKARLFLERSLNGVEGDPDPAVLSSLAICSYELEDEEAALHYIRKALALDPEHQEAQELLKALGQL